jgi:hypothetical protein
MVPLGSGETARGLEVNSGAEKKCIEGGHDHETLP